EGFRHLEPALERTYGTALARVEHVVRGPQAEQDDRPDQVVEMALVAQLEGAERKRRDAGQAGVAAEEIEVAEQKVEADSPGDGRKRQEVPFHAQGDEAEEQCEH